MERRKRNVIVKEIMQNANQIVEVQISTRPKPTLDPNIKYKPAKFTRNCLLKRELDGNAVEKESVNSNNTGDKVAIAQRSSSSGKTASSTSAVLKKNPENKPLNAAGRRPEDRRRKSSSFTKRRISASKPAAHIDSSNNTSKQSTKSKPHNQTWAEILSNNRTDTGLPNNGSRGGRAQQNTAQQHPTAAAASTPLEQQGQGQRILSDGISTTPFSDSALILLQNLRSNLANNGNEEHSAALGALLDRCAAGGGVGASPADSVFAAPGQAGPSHSVQQAQIRELRHTVGRLRQVATHALVTCYQMTPRDAEKTLLVLDEVPQPLATTSASATTSAAASCRIPASAVNPGSAAATTSAATSISGSANVYSSARAESSSARNGTSSAYISNNIPTPNSNSRLPTRTTCTDQAGFLLPLSTVAEASNETNTSPLSHANNLQMPPINDVNDCGPLVNDNLANYAPARHEVVSEIPVRDSDDIDSAFEDRGSSSYASNRPSPATAHQTEHLHNHVNGMATLPSGSRGNTDNALYQPPRPLMGTSSIRRAAPTNEPSLLNTDTVLERFAQTQPPNNGGNTLHNAITTPAPVEMSKYDVLLRRAAETLGELQSTVPPATPRSSGEKKQTSSSSSAPQGCSSDANGEGVFKGSNSKQSQRIPLNEDSSIFCDLRGHPAFKSRKMFWFDVKPLRVGRDLSMLSDISRVGSEFSLSSVSSVGSSSATLGPLSSLQDTSVSSAGTAPDEDVRKFMNKSSRNNIENKENLNDDYSTSSEAKFISDLQGANQSSHIQSTRINSTISTAPNTRPNSHQRQPFTPAMLNVPELNVDSPETMRSDDTNAYNQEQYYHAFSSSMRTMSGAVATTSESTFD